MENVWKCNSTKTWNLWHHWQISFKYGKQKKTATGVFISYFKEYFPVTKAFILKLRFYCRKTFLRSFPKGVRRREHFSWKDFFYSLKIPFLQ